jgi:tetratricopeptide (TPR) repeat protein
MSATGCRFPERDRHLADEVAGTPPGPDHRLWTAHLATCEECAEDLADALAIGAALDDLRAAGSLEAPAPGPSSPAPRGRVGRRWLVAAVVAVVILGALAWALAWRARGGDDEPRPVPMGPGVAAEAYATAWRLVSAADFPRALDEAQRALSASRGRSTVFQVAFCLAKLGRHADAIPLYEEAEALPAVPGPDGVVTEGWYVTAHRAQSLLARGPDAADEARVEELLRTDLAGPGIDRSRNRSLLWAELVRVRAFVRGDLEGAAVALAAAEEENLRHREESARDPQIGAPEDSHYVLDVRFAHAQSVRADAAATRSAARALRLAKEAVAGRSPPPVAAGYRADGREDEALAEILAARRGEPADLEMAIRRLEEAVALRREAGNLEGEATALLRLSWARALRGDTGEALPAAEGAERAAVRSGLAHVIADARIVRIGVLAAAGRSDEARALLQEANVLEVARRDPSRRLALAVLEARLSPDPERVRGARSDMQAAASRSPLADVRAVAALALRRIDSERIDLLGPLDVGFRP